MKKKKAFTLIELIAVLVILAILALIVTPLVMSIIRKARITADKRSIDAYGRSIELAIANYLLDNGDFPTSKEQLTIEYSGDEVECSTTQLNTDSSVYLAGCTVAGRNVENYIYGSDKLPTYTSYTVGDEVIYNNVDYYVIKDSGAKESTVTLLKAEPLTVSEVNQYGAGHINRYTVTSIGTTYDNNGYGGMVYYSSETCGYVNNSYVNSGCTANYEQSEIKYAIDAWKTAEAPQATEARLITIDDMIDNLGMELNKTNLTTYRITVTEDTPTWVTGENYSYWTMTTNTDKTAEVWYVDARSFASVYSYPVQGVYYDDYYAVRPVITLSKTNISS